MAAKRDRKAYQAAYYQRNKMSLNARRTAARRKIQADFARGRFKAQPKLQTEVSNYGMIGGCFPPHRP